MLHKVVVPFPCSWNGLTSVDLDIGDERDFGSMAAGLIGEGWIERIEFDKVAVAGAVVDEEPVLDFAAAKRKGR